MNIFDRRSMYQQICAALALALALAQPKNQNEFIFKTKLQSQNCLHPLAFFPARGCAALYQILAALAQQKKIK
jgi:hypothetical protein